MYLVVVYGQGERLKLEIVVRVVALISVWIFSFLDVVFMKLDRLLQKHVRCFQIIIIIIKDNSCMVQTKILEFETKSLTGRLLQFFLFPWYSTLYYRYRLTPQLVTIGAI